MPTPRKRRGSAERPNSWLRACRVAVGYTQQDMAEMLGMKRSCYAMKESGARPFTGAETIAIAGIFDRTPGRLFLGFDGDDAYYKWKEKGETSRAEAAEARVERMRVIIWLQEQKIKAIEAEREARRQRRRMQKTNTKPVPIVGRLRWNSARKW